MKEVVILGIGNILLKDDGVGVHVINALQRENLPSTTLLVDGGTSTLDMIGYFTDYPKVIVIDALRAGHKPGTIYKINPEEIQNYRKENLSLHDVQILDVIKMAKLLGSDPEVIIYGIEPLDISLGLEMTETVALKIPDLIRYIQNELVFEPA